MWVGGHTTIYFSNFSGLSWRSAAPVRFIGTPLLARIVANSLGVQVVVVQVRIILGRH